MDILYDFPQSPVGCRPGTLSFIIICYVGLLNSFSRKPFMKITLRITKKGQTLWLQGGPNLSDSSMQR